MTAGLTFLYGLFISGYLIDNAGVKTCMILGSLFLGVTRLLMAIVETKFDLYLICSTTFPIGLSMYIPTMTLGIKKCTFGKTRSLAYALFYAMLTTGLFLSGPSVDLIRTNMPLTEITFNGSVYEFTAYRMIFLIGFGLTFLSFLITMIFFRDIDVEEEENSKKEGYQVVQSIGFCQLWYEVLTDINFWKYLFFALITIGMKMIFNMLSLIIPKILTYQFGEHALYGMIISICPLCIVFFLFATSPCTVYLDPYSQIILGAFFNTFSPIALFFGITYPHIIMFIILVSLGEALSSPKMYEFIFLFSKRGREGMFLALTAAPQYLTMAVSGYVSGVLLSNFFPDKGEKKPDYIWITMMGSSGLSLVLFIVFRKCFKAQDKAKKIQLYRKS